jgi:hypothetical protein
MAYDTTERDPIATAAAEVDRIEKLLQTSETKNRLDPGSAPLSAEDFIALKAELARLRHGLP